MHRVLVLLCVASLGSAQLIRLLIPVEPRQEGPERPADPSADCQSHKCPALTTDDDLLDACQRGCRLLKLSRFHNEQLQSEQHLSKCNSGCATAYTDKKQQESCRAGCDYENDDQEGTGVVVMRKFSVEHHDGQEIRRSQSTLLVPEGDHMRVVRGPSVVSITHDKQELGGQDEGPAPWGSMDAMMQHMRKMMQHAMEQMGVVSVQDGQGSQDEKQAAGPGVTHREHGMHDRLMPNFRRETVESRAGHGAAYTWQCLWERTPHFLLVSALVAITLLMLYTCYLLVAGSRRRRSQLRRNSQMGLITDEDMAGELPPKYAPILVPSGNEKQGAPPAYTALAVSETDLPTKNVV